MLAASGRPSALTAVRGSVHHGETLRQPASVRRVMPRLVAPPGSAGLSA